MRVLLALLLLCAAPAVAQAPPNPAAAALERQAAEAHALQDAREEESVLPEGEGRSETFAYCTACHSTSIIRRSGFSRVQWDGLMDWMSERHGMNELEGELRTQIVDYLAAHFPPRQRRGGNPFLN
jgi:cytochrome c5